MAANSLNSRLAQERRARLQAEQLLALRSEELYSANRKLAEHANALSSQVIEQREENEALKGQTTQTKAQLEVATERAVTAQRRLWDALTATEDGFAIFDRDWRLVAANPAFFDVFDGITDVAEGASYEAILRVAVDEGVVDLQGEDPDDWVDRMIARWEMTPIPRADIKLWNGAYIRLNDKQTPQGDFVSLAVDVTPNIRRERKLRAARDAAMAASRAKSTFLANMSHEIRTPMNGVVSMAELLRETGLDEEQQLFADTIRNSGEALLVIINDILDYSKIEAGKLELREESFDLNAMVREIFRLLQPGIEGKQIELRLDYDIFLPDRMIGDRGRVRQVLTNLIGNAVKFTQKGNVTVHVLAGPPGAETDDLNVSIVVEDTGVGIAEDKQAHVFGEFNQVEDEANRKHDGTGLGLAISRRLVELMGGEMWLESTPGKGSAFGFVVRLKADPDGRLDPVAGLPVDRNRVLVIGGKGDQEDEVLDALGRLHAETTLLRRVPSQRDLDGTQAIILCDGGVTADDVMTALDEASFTGARLAHLSDGSTPDGYMCCPLHDGLSALRAQLLETAPVADPAPNAADDLGKHGEIEETASDVLPEPEPSPPSRTRPRLLAAEDNKTNQLVFKTMLKGLDLDIEIANNGLELLDAYKRDRPDLVMTDISMPEMDGLEASKLIRAFEVENGMDRIPIIAMTAHALEGDKDRILQAGLDEYVTKPLKKAVIQKMVQGRLGDGVVTD
ncbi:ATP-binding protein [Hasllibacter sp. MH4015]|uniref:ATP-binding protein n=1 Tax=Hasllibacter sp. MH4015 TaxID=2854029 RepID=UPI001CD4431B|nr:ATP-binding protein [Hasllibacter sp. MH4015]